MAKKISELPTSTFYSGAEKIVMVQDGITKSGSLDILANYLSGALLADSELANLSGSWENTYTTVSANSAQWAINTDTIYDDSLLQSTSGDWNSTYTTVSANSAQWGIDTIGGTVQGTGSNIFNLRAREQGNVTGLDRGEGSVDLQTSRETETQVASGVNSVITGGKSNLVSGEQDVIGGGYNNATYDPLGFNKVIGGGSTNYIIGSSNAIPGGASNSIESNYSFAAGQSAQAVHDGTFIFSDSAESNSSPFQTISANSANFKATGGLRLVDGNEAVGKVLTCVDDEGTGHWQEATGGGEDTSIQNLSALGSFTAPNPLVIDLTQGSNVEGWLTANVSLQLRGASAGQSGLITLGNGKDHDGVGFTVDFHVDNDTTTSHTEGGHSVMSGDLADFAVTPAAGKFNFGTIGWYYTGHEYFLYVSEVKAYNDSIQPENDSSGEEILYNTSEQLIVTGTLSPDATGIYTEAGTLFGEKYYTKDGYFIWNDGLGTWRLDNGTAVGGVGASATWVNAAFTPVDLTYTPIGGATGVATVTKIKKVQTSGTHTPDTTGVFVEQGIFNGGKYYSDQAGDFFIWYDNSLFQWNIDNGTAVGGVGRTGYWGASIPFGNVNDTYPYPQGLATGSVTVTLI